MIGAFLGLTFLLGLGVGSFVNVLVDRRERNEKINGRSYCEACGTTLRWAELIPLFSFLFQKGKCRNCSSKLSIQYPVVEFFTGLSFLVFAFVMVSRYLEGGMLFGTPLFVLILFFGFLELTLLMAIFVYDLKHKVIPNTFSYPFAFFAFLAVLFQVLVLSGTPLEASAPALQLIAGLILAFPFAFLWFVSKGKWMGLGDAKLALGIGWLLGVSAGFTSIVIGFWFGAIVGIFLMLYQWFCGKAQLRGEGNELTMKSELPLAPFLIIGFLVVFLTGFNFFAETFFPNLFS